MLTGEEMHELEAMDNSVAAGALLILGSVCGVIWAGAGLPGAGLLRWIALLPGTIGFMILLHRRTLARSHPEDLRGTNEVLRQQVRDLTALRDIMLAMGSTFDKTAVLDELVHAITQLLQFDRGLVLLVDDLKNALIFGAYSHTAPTPDAQFMLEHLEIALEGAGSDPLLGRWLKGESVLVDNVTSYLTSYFNWLVTTLDLRLFYSVPLIIRDRLTGVVIVDNTLPDLPISTEQRRLLDALAANIALTLENARLYQLTDVQLRDRVDELNILSQIDRELNEALSLDRVLNLTLDWAMRFTGTDAAAIALVNRDDQSAKFVMAYGYALEDWETLRKNPWPCDKGVLGRVIRNRQAEIVLDIGADPDYIETLPGTQSQMIVPMVREGQVNAVIILESRKPAAFTPPNLSFVRRLGARAVVAIDNTRLFAETVRERQKMEVVLNSIVDAVIVVNHDETLAMVNPAAIAIFRLSPKEMFAGRPFNKVFEKSPLVRLFAHARNIQQSLVEELKTADDRTFHASFIPEPQVGWLIVLHDITPFKKTEQLKNELVATASHDLKNPLSIVTSYLDLLLMSNPLNDAGQEYMQCALNATTRMRELIDDLLHMARIESGIVLRYEDVDLYELVQQVIAQQSLRIREKRMDVVMDVSPDIPPITADLHRVRQILIQPVEQRHQIHRAGGPHLDPCRGAGELLPHSCAG